MDMEEKKLTVDAAEQALPVQELPAHFCGFGRSVFFCPVAVFLAVFFCPELLRYV